MDRPIIAVLITLLATLAMVVPLGLSALSANQANATDAQGATASAKPLLYKLLAYNDKIDSYEDELRMDFILRVKHGAFDPQCQNGDDSSAAGTQTCALSFFYEFEGETSKTHYRRLRYMQTIPSDSSDPNKPTSIADPGAGAVKWAYNQNEYFTVHKVINSGLYDFLVISIEGDLSYGDKNDNPQYYQAGGYPQPLNLYAVVGPQNTLTCGSFPWAYNSDDCTDFHPESLVGLGDTVSNITADQGKNIKLYMGDCYANDPNRCSGPASFVGWDNYPVLWSGNQANWGLVTDYGLSVDLGNNQSKPYNPGIAPPNSFFVYWFNVRGRSNICSKTDSYYYQWVGLKNSQWMPVDSLTPKPVLLGNKQQISKNNAKTTSWGIQYDVGTNNANNSGVQASNIAQPATGPANELNVNAANPTGPQAKDGSIDFKRITEQEGFDGYFKLVTWPVTRNMDDTGTSNNCTVNPEVYNPMRVGLVGITDDMDATQKDKNLDTGWTIDTAFYKYDVPRPNDPTITNIQNDADGSLNASGSVYTGTLDPVVSGECTPSKDDTHPNTVTLYGEDSASPFREGQSKSSDDLVKSSDSWGFKLGETVCKVDPKSKQGGSWQIQDTNKQYPSPDPGNKYNGYRRYHAWVTESASGFGLTSLFSNIGTAYFVSNEKAPDGRLSVTVPHTKNGNLPANSVVTLKGTVSPIYTAWSSGGLGMTDSKMAISMKQNTASDWTSLVTTPANTFQRDSAVNTTVPSFTDPTSGSVLNVVKTTASTWSWSLNIPADKFKAYNGDDETEKYTFQVKMINPLNAPSDPVSINQKVDITPTTLTLERYDAFQVGGKAYKYVNGNTRIPETKGTLVHITWPDNTSTDVAVGDQGSWQASTPEGINKGVITAQVSSDDAESADSQSGNFKGGNESAPVSHELEFRPSNASLPLTGGWPLSVLKILAMLALGLVGFVACLRNRQESRY